MTVNVDFDADVAFAVADLGGTVTFSGNDFACVIDSIGRGQRMEGPEGIFAEISFQIVLQTSLVDPILGEANRPKSGDKVTVKQNGTETTQKARIVRVETDEANAALNLFCEEQSA